MDIKAKSAAFPAAPMNPRESGRLVQAAVGSTQPVTPASCTAPLRVVGGWHRSRPAAGQRPEVRRLELSGREVEVLLAWLRTESKAAVGRSLYIAPTTVHTHVERIRAKYDAVGRPARTKAALAARAIQDGYVALWDL